MGGVRVVERQQLRALLDRAAAQAWPARPRKGWIRAVRKALGMSGAALSRRLGGSRSKAANLERYEADDALSLRSLRGVAEALGCRLVYAIVPPEGKTIEDLLDAQAQAQARALLAAAGGQMALEAQSLSVADSAAEMERLKRELLQKPPRDFWDPPQAGTDA